MSSNNPSVANVHKIFETLSYEPVIESDLAVRTWINANNNGVLGPFINGSYRIPTKETLVFDVKNPFSGDVLAKVVNTDRALLNEAINSCVSSQSTWKSMSLTDRGRIIYNLARNVQKNLQFLTACESVNTGRTSREVKDLDVAAVIKTLYYYAGAVGSSADFDSHEPLGVVAIVGYFDSPLLSVVGKLAAALVAGNACLLVPNSLTPLSSYLLVELCIQSGVPFGVVNLIVTTNDEIIKLISRDPRIDCISFDGKLSAGQELVINQAFVHPSNKKTILSLEGKSSMVVYESADTDSAVECAVDGCFYANGQHRYSINKLFIQECIYDNFVQKLTLRFSKLKVGNHLDKCNDFGPLHNSNELKEALNSQSVDFGAEVILFEKCLQANKETLFAPTLVKNIALNSNLNSNEVNGPYLMLIPFRTVKESIDLLNNSKYGSGVSIHSQDISLVMEVASLLNVGTVWVNSFAIERGVQVRKFSGNQKLSGAQSIECFMKPKFEKYLEKKEIDVEEVKKKFKSVGALETSVPLTQNIISNKTYKLYIGGKQVRPDTQSSRPIYLSDKSLYCLVADSSRKDVRNAVEAACSAHSSWSKRPNHNKSQILYFLAENFLTRRNEFVDKLELLTKKSKNECEKEVQLCYDSLFCFASQCDKTIGQLNDSTEYGFLIETRESLGCIAIVCGSNSSHPLLSFVYHLTAAISNGNTVVIVPDEAFPVPALDFYEILETSDMPDGVCNILSGSRQHLTKYLVEHQQLSAIWYINESNEAKINDEELLIQQFIKFTSNHSLKHTWIKNNSMQIENGSVGRNYLKEVQKNSVQHKYIHIPMGVIFAN